MYIGLSDFIAEIHNMLFVSVKFEHSFHFHTNSSKTLGEIKGEIFAEIEERSKVFVLMISWMNLLSGLFFLLMFIKYEYCEFIFPC